MYTNRHTTYHEDLDIPFYITEDGDLLEDWVRRVAEEDYDDEVASIDFIDKVDDYYDQVLSLSKEDDLDVPAAIYLEELVRAQESDEFCAARRDRIDRGDLVPFTVPSRQGYLKERLRENHKQ